MSNSSLYQIGGSLQLDDPTYVTRKADDDLYNGLMSGDFCYVLNCRQMGKSSLRVKTTDRLKKEGVTCVVVQMTNILDEENTPDQFYAGVINSIAQDLDLEFDDMAWWESNSHLSLVNRFSNFLETVLLQKFSGRVVIFIDEIDRVLSLSFSVDGFFTAIRECFNKRADNPAFCRLTFSLLGVATPSDLIGDKSSTPFNVGKAIDLTGFTLDEARPLEIGLQVENPTEVLKSILRWTNGQPFLTQKICRIVAEESRHTPSKEALSTWVDSLVHQHIIQNWRSNDEPEHLRTIRDRLLMDDHQTMRRLELYQRVLSKEVVSTNTADSLTREYIELRLSGVVVNRDDCLCVYNSIYESIFTPTWTTEALNNLRPYATAFAGWIRSNKIDQSYLLKRKELKAVVQWRGNRPLPSEDYEFILASQELRAEEKRQELAKNNQKLGGKIGGLLGRQKVGKERLRERELMVAAKELAVAEKETAAEQTLKEGLRKCAEADKQIQEAQRITIAAQQAKDDLLSLDKNSNESNGCVGCMALVGITSLTILLIRFVSWMT